MTQAVLLAVMEKLKNKERSTWEEIERGGSHFIGVEKIIPEAYKRLQELKLDDTDDLYSLRLAGTERIWGLRSKHVLSVLWWDPEHKICPAEKKHT